ncbi:MAG: FprA family A-type flavoprotein [Eubacterium sp.]|nr:FprA family A-type flavoprotein [Eubacterium sp.]
MEIKISDSVKYIGCQDYDLDLFESQYIVPNGIAYNSYVILDDKVAVMDTVDARKTDEWLANLDKELGGRTPDYLVVQHLEPDHSGSVEAVAEKYPDMQIVSSAKAADMLGQFVTKDYSARQVKVAEGETLSLGSHTLQFFMAPMVHWPEVMVTYEQSEKILFAADGFGKFGTLDTDEDWACEARRYYFNIVGKYGAQVQALLKKAATLDIEKICALHGPILPDAEPLSYYIDKYDTWSKYEAEDDGVFVAYTSIHGCTGEACDKLGEILEAKGAKKVVVTDLAREDIAESVEDAFRYDKIILASSTYDGGLFPTMENFLYRLGHKQFQNKKVGFVENGSWAPVAAKKMREQVEAMKNMTICDTVVTLKSKMKPADVEQLEKLADEILA